MKLSEGGSADSEGETVTVKSIVGDTPRVQLAELTLCDPTLATARTLADKLSEGYHWEEGLLFRSRLDEWGDNYKQLCLSKVHRSKCLLLVHEKFGHQGRNKMTIHLKKLSLTSDVARHCLSCDVCLKHTNKSENVCPMQQREVVTIPSERVCV